MLSTRFREISFPAPLALKETVEPVIEAAPVVLPAVKVEPAVEASVVFPVEERVVKAAVDGVVAPIAVELIPVAVVLEFADVINKLFNPVEIEDAPKPVMFNAPEVAVKFNAPVV